MLSAFDVSVFCPSPTEGQPRAVIIGMLAGRPCVSTGAEGVVGLIEDSYGAIVSPENEPAALAAVLRRYEDDPERVRREGALAAKVAVERFDRSRGRRPGRAAAARENPMPEETRPLRLLVIDEGVLGHRTLKAQLKRCWRRCPGSRRRWRRCRRPAASAASSPASGSAAQDADLQALRWRLRWSWQGRKLLKRHRGKVDVALINTQALGLLAKGAMRELPTILSIDATVGQFTALEYTPHDRWTPRQLRLMQRLERRALKGAAAAMPWTGWNAAALESEYDLEDLQAETIHPGLDAGWWGEAAARRPRERQGPMRVLFVGNDVVRKGLPTLIEAVAALGEEAVLDVVSGDEIEEREFVRVHRGVTAGSERLRELYSEADVFALPTHADAVPWAVLEAMAAGLPVRRLWGRGDPGDAGRCG